MRIKRFFAKDMRSALAEVKEELGADAVIMSNKKVTGGIEIVAAVDVEPPPAPPREDVSTERELTEETVNLSTTSSPKKMSLFGRRGGRQNPGDHAEKRQEFVDTLASLMARQQPQGDTPPASLSQTGPKSLLEQGLFEPGKASVREPARGGRPERSATGSERKELRALQEEMSSIRQLLQHQLASLMDREVERSQPVRALLMNCLQKVGFSKSVAGQLVGQLPEHSELHEAFECLRHQLSERISVGNDDILRQGGAVALLGPTGVGKTTTVAKLAARFAMQHGAEQVAMITTDTYRIGAYEQLSTYGRIMGCTVKVVRDSEELSQALYQLRNRRLVLIDTAGMSQRDMRLSEQLETLMKNSRIRIRSYLVLSATAQRRILEDTLEHFKRIPLSGCILTKVDESVSLGEVLSVNVDQALPLIYLTNGQRVPEDINAASVSQLVDRTMEMMGGVEPDFAVE